MLNLVCIPVSDFGGGTQVCLIQEVGLMLNICPWRSVSCHVSHTHDITLYSTTHTISSYIIFKGNFLAMIDIFEACVHSQLKMTFLSLKYWRFWVLVRLDIWKQGIKQSMCWKVVLTVFKISSGVFKRGTGLLFFLNLFQKSAKLEAFHTLRFKRKRILENTV